MDLFDAEEWKSTLLGVILQYQVNLEIDSTPES